MSCVNIYKLQLMAIFKLSNAFFTTWMKLKTLGFVCYPLAPYNGMLFLILIGLDAQLREGPPLGFALFLVPILSLRVLRSNQPLLDKVLKLNIAPWHQQQLNLHGFLFFFVTLVFLFWVLQHSSVITWMLYICPLIMSSTLAPNMLNWILILFVKKLLLVLYPLAMSPLRIKLQISLQSRYPNLNSLTIASNLAFNHAQVCRGVMRISHKISYKTKSQLK